MEIEQLIMNENLLSPIITATSTIIVGIIVAYVSHKYTKDREKEELDRTRREANALVIDILAAWVHTTFDPHADDKQYNEYFI